MSIPALKLPKWGPPKLREIFKLIEDRVNQSTPIAGCGITASEEPDGVQISLADTAAPTGTSAGGDSGGGSSGTNVNLYGAFNGAPAIFHLKQSSAPTPVT